MKAKKFEVVKVVPFEGKNYTIMVYGELSEVKNINGFYAIPVMYNTRNNKVKEVDIDSRVLIPGFDTYTCKTKEFNMGWAICAEPDEFNRETGINICKRRFSRSPMRTQNGRFLTTDMCEAIVDNEIDYISNNIYLFLPKNKLIDIIIDDEDENSYKCNEGCLDISNEEACSTYCNPSLGDFVSFTSEGRVYVGIFKSFQSENGTQWNNMFFYAPVDSNGLIEHNLSRFFSKISGDTRFCMASEDEIKLINDYLLGAHGRMWDYDRQRFKLIIE